MAHYHSFRMWMRGGSLLRKRKLQALAAAAIVTGCSTTRADAESRFDSSRARVFSWGSSQYYQTGQGHAKNIPIPTEVENLSDLKIVKIDAGGQQSMALNESGRLFTFGRGEDYRMGHGANTNESHPRLVEILSGENIVAISCGDRHLAAVSDKGELWTWGKGTSGQLGHRSSKVPEKVDSLSGVKIVDVSCGSVHTLALTDDGRVYSTGLGRSGATGTGNRKDLKEFTLIESLTSHKITQIAAGEDFSLFLTEDGEVFSSGSSDFGQTGLGQAERYVRTPTKVMVLNGKKVVSIAAGSLHAAVATADGECYTWGENKRGQLGHGDNYHRWTPHEVVALENVRVSSVACGTHHTAVLTEPNHDIYVFGDGRSGQLGRGDNVESVASFKVLPVELTHFKGINCTVYQVALGSDHSLALCEQN